MLTRETAVDAGAHHGLTDRKLQISGEPYSKFIFVYQVSKPFVELAGPCVFGFLGMLVFSLLYWCNCKPVSEQKVRDVYV